MAEERKRMPVNISKRKVSCVVASMLVVPALVASVSLPFAGEQGTAYAATPAKVTSVKASNVTKSGFEVTWKKASSKKVKGYQLKVYKGKSLKKPTWQRVVWQPRSRSRASLLMPSTLLRSVPTPDSARRSTGSGQPPRA